MTTSSLVIAYEKGADIGRTNAAKYVTERQGSAIPSIP